LEGQQPEGDQSNEAQPNDQNRRRRIIRRRYSRRPYQPRGQQQQANDSADLQQSQTDDKQRVNYRRGRGNFNGQQQPTRRPRSYNNNYNRSSFNENNNRGNSGSQRPPQFRRTYRPRMPQGQDQPPQQRNGSLGRQNNYRPQPQPYRRYNNGPAPTGPMNRNGGGGAPRYFRKNTFDNTNRRPRNMRSNNPNSSQYDNVF